MDTKTNTQPVEQTNEKQTVQPTFVSTIKDLPIAVAGEVAKQPVKVSMQFEYADVVQDTKGATWVRLHMKGLSIPLFRNLKQASADLSNYIDSATAKHLSALGYEIAFNKHFRNKEVLLSASAYDVGSRYIVDENSTAFKEGKASIGEELTAESAGIRIEGFLRALLTEAENDAIYEQQLAYAREQASKVDSGTKFSIS
jgi:hypothetical protein